METAVHAALARWEPRIEVRGHRLRPRAASREGELEITIGYRIRATNRLHNLVYPFYVIPAEETE